jgi:alcohol dehydrogenase class IV
MQLIFNDFSAFETLIGKRPLLVCDNAFDLLDIKLPFNYIRFSEFTSNPAYEDIQKGVNALLKNDCDFIIAIGGGSSIDVAKSIKYYSEVDYDIMAIPTTAGTGSETTHFAAIYKDGEKISVADKRLMPGYVVLQPDLLKTLPSYQRKCTMLDALCQAVESWWAKKATPESIGYSKKAIDLICTNMNGYLNNENEGNKNMLIAANLAGKAINITTTTAAHAMGYKLSTLYGIAHGHAVAICLPKVWGYMNNFDDIAESLGYKNHKEAISFFERLLDSLEICRPEKTSDRDLDVLVDSVNTQRLDNNPIALDKETIRVLYKNILRI